MATREVYFRNADGIRGLACLIVLFAHSINGIYSGARVYLPGTGKVGVWLFFVLSAFLLTNHLFLRGTTMRSFIDYGVARIFRIAPLFVVAVLFYYLFGTTPISKISDVVNALALSKGYAHLWTIPVEAKFYVLLFPLAIPVIAICRKFGVVWSAIFVTAIGFASSLAFPFTGTPENSPQLRWYVPCFLIGVLCAVVYPSLRERIRHWPSMLISLVIIAVMVVMTDYFRSMYYPLAPHYWLGNKFIPLGALWGIFMLVNLDDAGPAGRILSSAPMTSIGRWSYPIYLFHWYFVTKAAEIRPDSIFSVAAAISLAIIVGALVHRYIERPVMTARKRLERSILRYSEIDAARVTPGS